MIWIGTNNSSEDEDEDEDGVNGHTHDDDDNDDGDELWKPRMIFYTFNSQMIESKLFL